MATAAAAAASWAALVSSLRLNSEGVSLSLGGVLSSSLQEKLSNLESAELMTSVGSTSGVAGTKGMMSLSRKMDVVQMS